MKTLKLSDNLLNCDCHLIWLSRTLKNFSSLGPNTRCSSPQYLKGQNIVKLQENEFKCLSLQERENSECSTEPQCPPPCKCEEGIVDCRENLLTKVPTYLPEDTIEL